VSSLCTALRKQRTNGSMGSGRGAVSEEDSSESGLGGALKGGMETSSEGSGSVLSVTVLSEESFSKSGLGGVLEGRFQGSSGPDLFDTALSLGESSLES
jgi:hypothetical protein